MSSIYRKTGIQDSDVQHLKKLEKQCYDLFGGWIRCCCHAKRADSTWSTTCLICNELSCRFLFKTAFFFKRNAQ